MYNAPPAESLFGAVYSYTGETLNDVDLYRQTVLCLCKWWYNPIVASADPQLLSVLMLVKLVNLW